MAISERTIRPNRLHPENVISLVAALLLVIAVSLAVASSLHLAGLVHGRSSSFDPDSAGAAEAVISVVLAGGAIAMLRMGMRARYIGIGVTAFALVGFLIGISETSRGGDIPDIAYHATVIPLLLAALVLLVRAGRRSGQRDS